MSARGREVAKVLEPLEVLGREDSIGARDATDAHRCRRWRAKLVLTGKTLRDPKAGEPPGLSSCPGLRAQHDVISPGGDCFPDGLFRRAFPIGIGGIDEVYAEIERPVNNLGGLVLVTYRSELVAAQT